MSSRFKIVEIYSLPSDERNGGKGQTAIRFLYYGLIKTSKLVYLQSVKHLQTCGTEVIICRLVEVALHYTAVTA